MIIWTWLDWQLQEGGRREGVWGSHNQSQLFLVWRKLKGFMENHWTVQKRVIFHSEPGPQQTKQITSRLWVTTTWRQQQDWCPQLIAHRKTRRSHAAVSPLCILLLDSHWPLEKPRSHWIWGSLTDGSSALEKIILTRPKKKKKVDAQKHSYNRGKRDFGSLNTGSLSRLFNNATLSSLVYSDFRNN